jgi:NAD(P)-dependent dehydrogenase (short-subunit alcohol dehydrogenase family)
MDSMGNILITGCSMGIGFATALELARAGHHVFATMRNPAGAPRLGEIAAEENRPVEILTLDVDSDESVRACFSAIESPIDVLVNNAGIEAHGSVGADWAGRLGQPEISRTRRRVGLGFRVSGTAAAMAPAAPPMIMKMGSSYTTSANSNLLIVREIVPNRPPAPIFKRAAAMTPAAPPMIMKMARSARLYGPQPVDRTRDRPESPGGNHYQESTLNHFIPHLGVSRQRVVSGPKSAPRLQDQMKSRT